MFFSLISFLPKTNYHFFILGKTNNMSIVSISFCIYFFFSQFTLDYIYKYIKMPLPLYFFFLKKKSYIQVILYFLVFGFGKIKKLNLPLICLELMIYIVNIVRYTKRARLMVLILDGSSEHGAHIWSKY